jgi:hypothetical protein
VKRHQGKYGQAFSRKIPEFKPKYELYLTGYAQIQSLLLQNDLLVALDNDNTVSMIRTSFSYPNMTAFDQDGNIVALPDTSENITHDLLSRKSSVHGGNIPLINQSSGSRANMAAIGQNQKSLQTSQKIGDLTQEPNDDDQRARRR